MSIPNSKTLATGILEGNKILLSRAITMLESTREEHNQIANEVIQKVLSKTGNAKRIGVTGVPGVGKSTFIEALGKHLLQHNESIAILAIDPSSQKSKGSILGDKTRMESISGKNNVFIRPSPAGETLGGVGRKTRESILLCEAAGFKNIFIETVGVGQSEIAVHSMVDCFLLLMLPGAGDELQGIKRGIMEMADIIAINKAEEDRAILANKAAREYRNALHLFPPTDSGWIPKVQTCSAEKNLRIDEVWESIERFFNHQKVSGYFDEKRKEQAIYWFRETVQQKLLAYFYKQENFKETIANLEAKIQAQEIHSYEAANEVLNKFAR